MKKKGDTLIEVTLAMGIFSMIAIAVVAVMNSGTSGSQSALETTLAREEIDAQAEALRFIQASYISDKDSIKAEDNRFQALWEEITSLAVEPTQDYTKYNPKSCEEVYSGDVFENAFIINTRNLDSFDAKKIRDNNSGVIFTKDSQSAVNKPILSQATTYPRLVFRSNTSYGNLIESVASPASKQLYRAEGIYIIAVRDDSAGTTIVGDTGEVGKKSAFFDFYIRSCWYSTGANTPSTISTVIRLYDPNAIAERDGINLIFDSNGGTGSMNTLFVPSGAIRTLPENGFEYGNVDESLYDFVGWSTNSFATVNQVNTSFTGTYKPGDSYKAPSTFSKKNVRLYAIWDIQKFWVDVNMILDGTAYNSGLSNFKVKSYIDSEYITEEKNGTPFDNGDGTTTTVVINDHDFYQPVNFGSKVRVELFDPIANPEDGITYTLDTSKESLCGAISPCKVLSFDGGTAVEFTVNSIPPGTTVNSTGRLALNIVPHWTSHHSESETPEEP